MTGESRGVVREIRDGDLTDVEGVRNVVMLHDVCGLLKVAVGHVPFRVGG